RAPPAATPASDLSIPSMVYTRWLQIVGTDPALRRLPIKASGSADPAEASFEALARTASRGNVHHRAILDDLARLGMVQESDHHVELVGDGFVPTGNLREMLDFLGNNARDHLEAAATNTLAREGRMLERAVFAGGLSAEECERLQRMVRERWKT